MIASLTSNGKFLLYSIHDLARRRLDISSLPATESLHAALIKAGNLHRRHTFIGNSLQNLYSQLGAADHAISAFHELPFKNTFSYNILLKSLLKAGRTDLARQLFDEMPHRDPVSFNTMISGFMSNGGAAEEAFGFLYSMRESGIKPTDYTYSIAASFVFFAAHAKELHGSLTRARDGLSSPSPVAMNSVILMYGRLGFLCYASRVFAAIVDPDTASWNSMILMYKVSHRTEEAFGSFDLMKTRGFLPDEFTMSTLISVCADIEDLSKGERFLAECFKAGIVSNSIVSSSVIDMYSQCGKLAKSVQLFQELRNYDSALCNSMASAYARDSLVPEALRLFALLLRKGTRPTEFTFATILSSGSCYGQAEQGMQIHCWIVKLGLEKETIVASTLVDMYVKLGSTKDASRILSAKNDRDLVSWNTIILGLAQNGDAAEAVRIFREIQEHGHRPDRITILGVLMACGNEGMVAEGMSIFSSMESGLGIKPDFKHYACMVDMLGRAGMMRDALEIIGAMKGDPGPTIWDIFLEHCHIHREFEILESAAEKLVKMELCSVLPFVVMARVFAARGRWEGVARVLKAVKEKGLRKPSDFSWISIRSHIYTFRDEHLLHCGGEKMYSILRLLAWEMEVDYLKVHEDSEVLSFSLSLTLEKNF